MIKLTDHGVYLINGTTPKDTCNVPVEEARKGTIAYSILTSHNTSGNAAPVRGFSCNSGKKMLYCIICIYIYFPSQGGQREHDNQGTV